MTKAVGSTEMKSTGTQSLVYQAICRFKLPDSSMRSVESIETFIRAKKLDTIANLPGEIDWGRDFGGPVLYIKVVKTLSSEELNALVLAIQAKGLETFTFVPFIPISAC